MTHRPRTPPARTTAPSAPAVPARAESSAERPTTEDNRERLLTFLRAITDNLGEGTYALDTDGRLTFMNPAAERMLGWTEAELRGKDMHQTIHFQHADGTPFPSEECPLLRVMRTGQVERIEDDTFTRRDGVMFPVSYVSSPITMGGVVSGAVLAFHDISAHQALDEALRRSERAAAARASQLMAIFESIADAVLVYDRDGQITQTNGADDELFGEPEPPTEPAADASRTLEPRDRQMVYRDEQGRSIAREQWPMTRVLGGETLRGASAVDVVRRASDGREVVINASGAPIRDAEGAIVGGVLIGRDVTQRRRLERQTREALTAMMAMAEALVSADGSVEDSSLAGAHTVAQRLAELARAVMGCARVGVHVYNAESNLAQTLAIAGLTKEQQERVSFTARLNNPQAVVQRLQAGEVVVADFSRPPYDRWTNPLGSRAVLLAPVSVGGPILGDISVDFGAEPHTFTADEFALASAVGRLAAQIIERERLARDREMARANVLALAEITRRMDEFLGVAAHELRSPVTNGQLAVSLAIDTVNAMLAQANESGATESQQVVDETLRPIQGLLERTGGHMERLSRLVVDLLDVSRIRAGRLELRVAPCDLDSLLRDVIEEQRQMAPGRNIHLRLPAASSRSALVLADADRIRQVVTNYLTNALKYSHADQPVTVRLHSDGEWARVSVQDHGPGIPPTEQRRVWERFYRVEGRQALSGASVGLGLGLYISRAIVEQHQGRVGVRNAQGNGAVFWFALQLLASDM